MEFHICNGYIPNNEYRELGYSIRDISLMISPEKIYDNNSDYHIVLTSSDISTIENTIDLLNKFLNAIREG